MSFYNLTMYLVLDFLSFFRVATMPDGKKMHLFKKSGGRGAGATAVSRQIRSVKRLLERPVRLSSEHVSDLLIKHHITMDLVLLFVL